MFKIKLIFITLAITVSATWAGDIEDADAAFKRKDYAAALVKYKSAVAKKEKTMYAQYQIGNFYAEGLGVKKNLIEAINWYKLSAEQGFTYAQFNLGGMYYRGEGIEKNVVQAVYWYKKAAAQGDELAQHSLGIMYAEGQGLVKDMTRAHMWLNLAAANGSADSPISLKAVSNAMTSQQIAEAQKMARECQARKFKNCD